MAVLLSSLTTQKPRGRAAGFLVLVLCYFRDALISAASSRLQSVRVAVAIRMSEIAHTDKEMETAFAFCWGTGKYFNNKTFADGRREIARNWLRLASSHAAINETHEILLFLIQETSSYSPYSDLVKERIAEVSSE